MPSRVSRGDGRARRAADGRRIATPRARVTLRITIGVYSDALHLFLVGDSHLDQVVCGPRRRCRRAVAELACWPPSRMVDGPGVAGGEVAVTADRPANRGRRSHL